MKKTLPLFLIILLMLVSCSSDQEQRQAVGLVKSVQFCFSDKFKKDTFKLVTQGDKSEDMWLVFTITNTDNKQIYSQKIKASELLNSYLASADLKKEQEKQKFIKDEVDYFFNEEHFLAPAVTDDEQPDQNAHDKIFYKELKTSGLNGFMYRLGKDKNYYIAWSAKEQKVKIYYSCC